MWEFPSCCGPHSAASTVNHCVNQKQLETQLFIIWNESLTNSAPAQADTAPVLRCITLLYCALIRKKGIELWLATKPCLSLLLYFVKDDETWRKGKLRFYAIPFKIFIRLGRAGREKLRQGVEFSTVSSLVNWEGRFRLWMKLKDALRYSFNIQFSCETHQKCQVEYKSEEAK